jgi:hypothetical protein
LFTPFLLLLNACTGTKSSQATKKAAPVMTVEEPLPSPEEFAKRVATKREDLIWAARSRLLTQQEWTLLRTLGPDIFVKNTQPYNRLEVEKRFDELLLQQERLRRLSEKH